MLLEHMAQPSVLRQQGVDLDRSLILKLPSERLESVDVPGFWKIFLREISAALAAHPALRPDSERESCRALQAEIKDLLDRETVLFLQFKEILERLTEEGFQVFIFWDNFEAVARNKNLGVDTFSGLRSLAGELRVTYLIASEKELAETVAYNLSSSPFFNIFAVVRLKPLTIPPA